MQTNTILVFDEYKRLLCVLASDSRLNQGIDAKMFQVDKVDACSISAQSKWKRFHVESWKWYKEASILVHGNVEVIIINVLVAAVIGASANPIFDHEERPRVTSNDKLVLFVGKERLNGFPFDQD